MFFLTFSLVSLSSFFPQPFFLFLAPASTNAERRKRNHSIRSSSFYFLSGLFSCAGDDNGKGECTNGRNRVLTASIAAFEPCALFLLAPPVSPSKQFTNLLSPGALSSLRLAFVQGALPFLADPRWPLFGYFSLLPRLRFNASRALRIHSPGFEESKEALSLDPRRRASDRFAAPTRCPARRKGDLTEETEWRMRNSRAQVCNMIFGIGMRLSALLSRPLYALQIEVSYRNIQAMGEPK